jgi:cytochrome b561
LTSHPRVSRFGLATVSLHWFTLPLLVLVYACINLADFFPEGSDTRALVKTWHFMLGLSVLVLADLRVFARAWGVTPPIFPEPPLWQSRLASVIHVALYCLMISMPILGWMLLSAAGRPIPFFGLNLPSLMSENRNLADQIQEIHESVGTIGYFLIGAHALAAPYHHYALGDNTLLRMLPGKR